MAEDRVTELAERARDPIRRAAHMEPDYSVESLAAVDHFLSQLPAAAPNALLETAAQLGCYFGEVVRRALGGHWDTTAREPQKWRLVLSAAPLSFHPIGMAAEAIYKDEVDGYDGSLEVSDALRPLLARALEAMGEVDEEYYYSLTGRLETVQHVLDVLVAGIRTAQTRAVPERPRRS